LKKQIEEDCRRWKDLPHSWIIRITIVKMAILQKAIYKFSAILIIPEIARAILKLIWKHTRLRNSQSKLEQKEQF
jgi:hypothetical protein